ncbi:MAG: prolyl oligopeptidase family serine peptidase, partial [Chloroflexota bacterium]
IIICTIYQIYLVYGANYDVEKEEEIEPTVVIKHNLETGERVELARPETSGFNIPELSPDGNWILYDTHAHPAGWQQSVISINGEHDRQVLNVGADKKAYGTWTNDSQSIVFIVEGDGYNKVGLLTLETGEIRWLIDDPNRSIESVTVPHNCEGALLTEVIDARSKTTLLNLETRAETPFPNLQGTLNPIAPVTDTDWLGVYYSSTQPAEIVRFPLSATSLDELVSISHIWSMTTLSGGDLTTAEDFRWESTDGLPIQGWLYRPTEDTDVKGTIVYVHGGPTAHSRDAINNQIQFFVRQGFNVLDPNYRGSTGFGLAFREKIKEDGWGGMEQVDIEMGIRKLIDEGIAEAGKVGMTGTSYGGYSSWHGITHFPVDTLSASAPICGMTDLVVDYQTTRPDLRPYSEEMLGGSPDDVPEKYHERSPINFVQNINGRLLIIQGMQDPNVHPDNVREVREKLDAANVEYSVLPFEDEGHGIRKPKNQKVLYQELASFFSSAFDG